MVLCRRLRALGLISFLPLYVVADQYENEVDKVRVTTEQSSSIWKGGSVYENPTEDPNNTLLAKLDGYQQNIMVERSPSSLPLLMERREEEENFDEDKSEEPNHVKDIPFLANPNQTDTNTKTLNDTDTKSSERNKTPTNVLEQNNTDTNTTEQNKTDTKTAEQNNTDTKTTEQNTTNANTTEQNNTDTNTTEQNNTNTIKANQSLVVHFEYKLDFYANVKNITEVLEYAKNRTIHNLSEALDTFFGDDTSSADVILEGLEMQIIGSCDPAEGAMSCSKGNGTITLAHSNEIKASNLFNTALTETQRAIAVFNEVRKDSQLTYLGPKHFTAEVYVDLRGVPLKKMDENDTDIFEDTLLEFLDERLKEEFGDHVVIQQVTVATQFISVKERRALRSEFAVIRRDAEENSNRVLVHVTGLCGIGCDEPPNPEDVADSIDAGSSELLRKLKENAEAAGSDYFEEVRTIITGPVKPPPIKEAPPMPQDGDNLHTEDGFTYWALFLIAAPVVAAIIVCCCFFRAVYSKKGVKDAEVHAAPMNLSAGIEPEPDDTENLVGLHRDDTSGYFEPLHAPPPAAFRGSEQVSKSTIDSYNVSKSTIVSAKSEREPDAPPLEQTDSGLWNRKMDMTNDRQPDEFEDEEDDLWQRKIGVGRDQEETEIETFGDDDITDGTSKPGAQAANAQEDKLWQRKVAVGNEDNEQQTGDDIDSERNDDDDNDTAGETKPGAQNVQDQGDELWERKVTVANEAQTESRGADDNTEETKPGAQHTEDERDERWERKIAVTKETPAEVDIASQSTEQTTNTSKVPGVEKVKKEDEDSLWARKMDEASKADDDTTDT